MRSLITLSIVVLTFVSGMQGQKAKFFQNFEDLPQGQNILTLKNKGFKGWGKTTFTVTEKAGKGYNNSNKYASSGGEENITLVKNINLEAGKTYVFSAAVKMTNVKEQSWKGNYVVKVSSGKKGDVHIYGKEEIKEPAANTWQNHKIKFTVKEGREAVMLQVYRWAKNTTLNVDDFKLISK